MTDKLCHYFNLSFLESLAKPIPHADSLYIILTAALCRFGNKWLIIYRTLGIKQFFHIRVIRILSDNRCFLFSYLRSVRSMVKSLLVMELNQSLMLFHTEVMRVLWDVSWILSLSRLYKQKFLPQPECLLLLLFC